MVRLWEVTTEQAQAMYAPEAKKLLEMHDDEAYSETAEREIAKYVLVWDWGNPEPPHPPFTYEYHGDLGRDGVRAFKYWETRLPHEQLMNLKVIDSMGLKPEVRAILLTRVNVQSPGPLPTKKIKRSKMGWDDPISAQRFKNGDRVIRLDGKDTMIFLESSLTQWLTTRNTNPLTNQAPTSKEGFIVDIEEDNGEPPAEGGRRKTRKYKRRAKKTRRHK